MTTFIIIISVAVVTVIVMYTLFQDTEEIKEEEPKFQPRKVTDLSKGTIGMDPVEKPKRKKKKYYNKKKKAAVANNETTEKRPVGRPRKTTE